MSMYPEQTANYGVAANGHAVHPPQIAMECETLGMKTELLLKQLADLDLRLSSILRPTDMVKEMGPNKMPSEGPLAPHADFLRSRNHLLEMATDQLASILNRIEL